MLEGSSWGLIGGDEVFSVISYLYGVRVERTDGMRGHCSFSHRVNIWDQSYSFVVYMAMEKDRASQQACIL